MVEPLLDIDGIAKCVRVSPRTIRRWMAEGEGPPYIRVGNEARWAPADVEQWKRENRFASLAEEYAVGGRKVTARRASALRAAAAKQAIAASRENDL